MRPIKEYRTVSLPDSASCDIGRTDRAACEKLKRSSRVVEVFRLEAEKAQKEISERLNHVDEWFHYKFILVGLLFGTIIGYVVKENSPIDGALADFLKSSTCCIVVAIACTIAIAVDVHIRNDIVAIQQLGSWLAYHAEPHMSGIPFEDKTVLFWEKFLRQADNSMHTDLTYGYLFYPHLHFLTWVVYALYLWVFQIMCLPYQNDENKEGNEAQINSDSDATCHHNARDLSGFCSKPRMNQSFHKSDCWMVFATFVLVHMSLLAFVFMATLSPGQFEFRLPYVMAESKVWSPPWETCILYVLVLVILITMNARYIVMLKSKCDACPSPRDKTVSN